MPRKVSVAAWGAALFISWNAILLLYLMSRPKGPDATDLTAHVIRLAEEAETELEKQKGLLEQIHHYSGLLKRHPPRPNAARGLELPQRLANVSIPSPTPLASDPEPMVIPILVVACDRPSVRKCLDSLLKYRPSAEQFPIIVSQDCGHAETARTIDSYGDAITHINQPDLSEVPAPPEHRKFQGYYKISRHYRWALNQVSVTGEHSSARSRGFHFLRCFNKQCLMGGATLLRLGNHQYTEKTHRRVANTLCITVDKCITYTKTKRGVHVIEPNTIGYLTRLGGQTPLP